MILEPDYPQIVFAFTYRDWEIKIDRSEVEGEIFYTAWADYKYGSAVAEPGAKTRIQAVRNAKNWVDRRIGKGS